jgi:hypothetical protein
VTGKPVYRQVLGHAFDRLDEPLRRFHSLHGMHHLRGQCSVSGAEHPLGRLVCFVLRLPPAVPHSAFRFDLDADADAETWTRHFPGRTMRSSLSATVDGHLQEKLGPARLLFSLQEEDGSLSMHLESIRFFGLPWPRRWFPSVWAIECGDGDRFCFDVGARLRLLGTLVAYSGYLEPDDACEPS